MSSPTGPIGRYESSPTGPITVTPARGSITQMAADHDVYAIAVVKSRTADKPDIKLLGAYQKIHDAKTSIDTLKQSLAFGRDNNRNNEEDSVEVVEYESNMGTTIIAHTIENQSSTREFFKGTKKFERLIHLDCNNRRFIPEITTHLVILDTEIIQCSDLDGDIPHPYFLSIYFPSWHFEARDANQEAFLIAMENADDNTDGWCEIKARYVEEQAEFCVEKSASNGNGESHPYTWVLVMKASSQSKAWGQEVWSSAILSPEKKATLLCQRALEFAK